jgi:hypothetical protein
MWATTEMGDGTFLFCAVSWQLDADVPPRMNLCPKLGQSFGHQRSAPAWVPSGTAHSPRHILSAGEHHSFLCLADRLGYEFPWQRRLCQFIRHFLSCILSAHDLCPSVETQLLVHADDDVAIGRGRGASSRVHDRWACVHFEQDRCRREQQI